MTERYFLRPITPGEFEAYCEVPQEAFNDAERSAEAIEQERVVFEFDRSIAAFDGAVIVGTTGAYSFQLTVPGGVVSAAGVTFVSVLPSHRRQGILSAMMRHQLADIAARGEPVAALFASESIIYGRYGYGCGSSQLSLTIRRGDGGLNPAAAARAGTGPGAVRLRTGQPGQLGTELAKVYDVAVLQRPGMMARDERWWQSLLADPDWDRRGMSPLKCLLAADEAGPRGYALYRTKPDWDSDGLPFGSLTVRELIAADGTATAALWADLLTRDLIGEVVARARPVDDPLLDMLADRRRARAYLTDALWIRLIDLPAARQALCLRGRRCARGDRRAAAGERGPVAVAMSRARRRSDGQLRTHHRRRRSRAARRRPGGGLSGRRPLGRPCHGRPGHRAEERCPGDAFSGHVLRPSALVPVDVLTRPPAARCISGTSCGSPVRRTQRRAATTRMELAMDGEVPIRPPWPRLRWDGGQGPGAGPVYCPPAIDDLMAAIATYQMLDEQRAGAIREVTRQTIA